MILKYVSFHGASYSDSLDYLIYQHDEKTRAKLYDENGNRQVRQIYLMDGLQCTPFAFPRMAEELNREYRKNLDPGERNMIMFIISYHPDDMEYRHLDIYRAHELSLEWVHRCLPGMLGVACTHPDGDHHTRNIHTHVLLCSLQYKEEISESMEHPYRAKRGTRFHPLNNTWREFYKVLDEIAQREGLSPCQLPGITPKCINNGEYHARWRGQKKLEEENRIIINSGGVPQTETFRTEKEEYRYAIGDACSRSRDLPGFEKILLEEYGIRVTETNGKWQYFREGTKGYSPRTLGSDYFKEKILIDLRENQKNPDRIEAYLDRKKSEGYREMRKLKENSLPGYIETLSPPYRDDITGDICRAVYEKGMAIPTREGKVKFLQPYAEAVRYLRDTYRSKELPDLGEAEITKEIEDRRKTIDEARLELAKQEALRFFRNVMRAYSPLKEELITSDDPERFRQEHQTELQALEAAEQFLGDVPMKSPEEQKEELWQAGFRVYARQEDLGWLESNLETIRKIKRDLNPIMPELERARDERQAKLQQKMDALRKERERSEPRKEKQLIPLDYER